MQHKGNFLQPFWYLFSLDSKSAFSNQFKKYTPVFFLGLLDSRKYFFGGLNILTSEKISTVNLNKKYEGKDLWTPVKCSLIIVFTYYCVVRYE